MLPPLHRVQSCEREQLRGVPGARSVRHVAEITVRQPNAPHTRPFRIRFNGRKQAPAGA